MSPNNVIAVDLDGTLTLTDTLHESVLLLVRNKPFMLLMLPFWLAKGLAFFKVKVAENSQLDVTTVPYNEPLIDWLRNEKASGKKIVLCSATNERIALAVAEHLQLFDDVMASDAITNLKNVNKRKALEKKYGVKGYDYAGNSSADIEVWAGSRQAIVVNASPKVHAQATQVAPVSQIFPSHSVTISDWLRALRIHQWLKNMLLFAPLLAAHQLGNIQSLSTLVLAFISFSLCASSVYIANDLLDLESDRRHPRKRNRPFAAAKLPIVLGAVLSPLLVVASLALGLMVSSDFLAVLILYFLLTTVYSLVLKRIVLVDCLTLAMLFTLRIIAGAAAVSVSLSFWFMAFSVFIFLSLALVKRYAELLTQVQAGNNHAHGRGYSVTDAPLIQTLGVAAGYSSILVLALYIRSEAVMTLYALPTAIWFAIPLLLFWISWVWLKANRGEMHDDPIVFAFKDKASLVVAGLAAAIFVFAVNGLGS